MFCHKCGAQIAEGAAFCHKCGTKVVHEDIDSRGSDIPQGPEPMVTPTLKSVETTMLPVEMPAQPEPRQSSVELVVTCAKLKGFFPGSVFPLLVDKGQVGELPNNGTFTSRIAPGPHQIKVGNVAIGINIPESETTVALKLQPGPSKTLEFVCNPGYIVTVPSSIERATRQDMLRDLNATVVAGLVCAVLGVIGLIIAIMIPMGYPTLDYVISIFVSAIFLIASGGVFLILSPKTRKPKAKKAILGLVSVIAIGAVIVMVSSTVSFINWDRMKYVNAVKNTQPFDTVENRQYWSSISYAYSFSTPDYDAVLSNYIDPIEWQTVDKDSGRVDVIGTLEGTGEQITIHFSANAGSPYEIILDDTSFADYEDICAFLYAMFDAYVKDEEFYVGDFLRGDTDTTSNILADADQLLFQGTPIQDIMGAHSSDIIAIFGEPAMYTENYELDYSPVGPGMYFGLSDGDIVDYLTSIPSDFTYNGHNLDQDFDSLVAILGDDYTNMGGTAYSWQAFWNYGDYQIYFTFSRDSDDDKPYSIDVMKSDSATPADDDDYSWVAGDIDDSLLRDQALVGRWRAYDGGSVEFDEYGNAAVSFKAYPDTTNTPDRLSWETYNGQLILTSHFTQTERWTITGKSLRLTLPNGGYSTYTRTEESDSLLGTWDCVGNNISQYSKAHVGALVLLSDGTGAVERVLNWEHEMQSITWQADDSNLYTSCVCQEKS